MISLRTGMFRGSGAVFTAMIMAALGAGSSVGDVSGAPGRSPNGPHGSKASHRFHERAPRPVAQLAKTRVRKAPPVPGEAAPGAEIRDTPEYADALPSEYHPPPEDLLLQKSGEQKAEAMAAFASAVAAEDRGSIELALALYRRVLALDPAYADLAVQVAVELAKRDEVPTAIQVLKDAIKASPKEPEPLVYLSQLYSRHLKKPELAMKYAVLAVAQAPESFSGYLAAYELHMTAGDTAKAEAVLEQAAQSKTKEPKFWVQLGDLYTRLYLKEDGSSEPANQARMNAMYEKAADLGKDDASIQAKVGDYYVLSRQVKEAIPHYQAALKAPNRSDDNALLNLRDKLARAYLIDDRTDEAIGMLEQILVETPMRYETYEMLGELYEKKGELDKALGNFERSLLLDGSRPEGYLRVADMYLRQRKTDKAVAAMKAARARFPDIPQITFTLAITLSQAKKHTEAMTAFAEARADAELRQPDMLDPGFYFQYGAAAEQAGLMDKAAELMRESIRLDPGKAAQAYNYLGYMWVDKGMNLEEAGGMIRKALEMDPGNEAYLDSLGWYYFKTGRPEQALTELLRAAEAMKEGDPVVYDHIGDAYQALGQTTEALSYWQKAIPLEGADEKIAGKIEAAKQQAAQKAEP